MDIFLVYLVFISAVCAVELGDSGGLHFETNGEYAGTYDNYKPRDYQFEYGVSDPHTGDHKSHWEVRENGVVKGSYSLLEPDGTTRVVDYVADKYGFRAVVKKLGTAIHPVHVDTTLKPIIVEDTDHSIGLTEPLYKSYDGYVDNYNGLFDGESKHAPSLLEGINSDDYNRILSSNLELQQPLDVKIPPPSLLPDAEIGDLQSQLIGEYNIGQILPISLPKAEGLQIQKKNPIHGEYQDYNIEQILPISLPKAEGLQIQKWNNNYGSGNLLGSSYQEHYTPQQSSSKIVHPHGISSSHYHGVTGNSEDDSRYTNYGNGNGWKIEVGDVGDYSQAESVVLPHNHKFSPKIEPLPYHFVINHPVLH